MGAASAAGRSPAPEGVPPWPGRCPTCGGRRTRAPASSAPLPRLAAWGRQGGADGGGEADGGGPGWGGAGWGVGGGVQRGAFAAGAPAGEVGRERLADLGWQREPVSAACLAAHRDLPGAPVHITQ